MVEYYTPTIDEFYAGFEYERMNGNRWEEFEGTIKNKSELIKLMKQLNIL